LTFSAENFTVSRDYDYATCTRPLTDYN